MPRKLMKKTKIKSAWLLLSNGFGGNINIKREYSLKKRKKRAVERIMTRKQLKKRRILRVNDGS